MLFLLLTLYFSEPQYQEGVKTIDLEFEDEVFYLDTLDFKITLKGIFVIHYSARGMTDTSVVRYQPNGGRFVGIKHEPGPGPGETRRIIDLDVDETHLYLAETSLGIIHPWIGCHWNGQPFWYSSSTPPVLPAPNG